MVVRLPTPALFGSPPCGVAVSPEIRRARVEPRFR